MYRRSFELPVKCARSFDRRSNVPGLMIGTVVTFAIMAKKNCQTSIEKRTCN